MKHIYSSLANSTILRFCDAKKLVCYMFTSLTSSINTLAIILIIFPWPQVFAQSWFLSNQNKNNSNRIIKERMRKFIRYSHVWVVTVRTLRMFSLTYFINSTSYINLLLICICYSVFTLNFSNLLNLTCMNQQYFSHILFMAHNRLYMTLGSLPSLFSQLLHV